MKLIFVENEPEDYDLEKGDDSDFYSLPDGTLSHSNLINAMFEIFRSTGDKLGQLVVSWYFSPTCPDRPLKPVIEQFKEDPQTKDIEMNEAIKSIKTLNINMDSQELVPTFDFHSLGYAFCPVTESKKGHFVLNTENQTTLVVGSNSKFLVPDFAKIYKCKETSFRKLSYENKEGYEFSKKSQYGLDIDAKLIVGVSSSGKWIRDAHSSGQDSEVSVVTEICLASISIDNPEKFVAEDVITALRHLPSSYKNEPEKFNEFFSKFGSHFVNRVKLGGSVKMDCKIKTASYDSDMESKIEAKASGIFKLISAGGNYSTESACKELESIGISDTRITITGGTPPVVTALQDLTQQKFQDWIGSVELDPSELDNSFSLYPYYNLSQCEHKSALREATMDYLQQSLKYLISKRREDIAKKAQEEVTSPAGGSSCFPGSTMVRIADGGSKKISELHHSDRLTTVCLRKLRKSPLSATASTGFCTFLHQESNTKAKFLSLTFSNNSILKVTANHLIFSYQPSSPNRVRGILAGSLRIGDLMVYVNETGEVSYPQVVDIKEEYHNGIYAPLTSNGTFLADGFLVTSYADMESFDIANTAMAPLKLWHGIKQSLDFHEIYPSGYVHKKHRDCFQSVKNGKEGMHEYAKCLMVLRSLWKK